MSFKEQGFAPPRLSIPLVAVYVEVKVPTVDVDRAATIL
jgi:hypothetical protein